MFSPGSGCPPRCRGEGAVPPAGAAAVRHGERLGCPRVRVRPARGAAAGARGGPPGPVLRSSNEWGRARLRRAAAGVNKVT